MVKKVFLLFFLVLFCTQVFSSGITSYVVPDSVTLNQKITSTGVYEDGNNSVTGIKCSFYFLNDLNEVIERATDEYTTETGRFVMTPFQINEPVFLRGESYILKTECGAFGDEQTFIVLQRESIAHTGAYEFDYFTLPENTDTIFIWVICGLSIVGFLGFFVFIIKYVKGK